MENTKRALFIGFFILLALQNKGQDFIATEIPNINQLPTKEILCIFQDSEGYIWYGTGGGLCRDDGYQIKVFRSDFNTPGLLENNNVTSITEDKDKKIWFGTRRGAYILDKKNYRIKNISDREIKGWVIKGIKATSDGSIWIIVGSSLFRYNTSGEKQGRYELKWKNDFRGINYIYEDNKGEIWVTQYKGGLHRYDPGQDQFVQYPWPYNRYPTCIIKDATTPYYWIGTWGDGIVRFNPEEQDTDRMFVPQKSSNRHSSRNKKRINSIAQDSITHSLWITSDNLYTYGITKNDTLHFVDTSGFLSGEKKILNHAMCDRLGNIWVTGNYPSSYSFVVSYLPNKIISYPMDLVNKNLDIHAAPMKFSHEKDFFWVRQRQLGLYVYDTDNNDFRVYDSRSRSLSLFFEKATGQDGVFIVLSESEVILVQYDGQRFTESAICKIPAIPSERIRTLHNDKHGNLWIGTTYNLFKYDLKQKKLEKVCENTGIINDIVSLNGGDVYIATESEGFWKIAGNKKISKHDTKENYWKLAVSPDRKIWLGTQQGNVYCYNVDTGSFISQTEACGLIGDAITDLLFDDYGNIWILTDQKITVYNPEKQAVKSILSTDLSILPDNFLSLNKGKNGEMYVGGRGGIMAFLSLGQFENTIKEPSISLTSITINNVRKILGEDDRDIVLKPQERNIELFFSTFDPLNSGKIRYAFRRKQDKIWNYLPVGQNSIYLAGLSKGDYTIEVRATDVNGSWTKNTTTIQIRCLPDWYETWWAYTLYLLIIFAIVIFVIQKYIQSQKEKQKKQAEEEVSQMKYRFFTNVSHELRTPLTLVITPLESIIKKISDINVKQQLEAISKNAQSLLGLVNQLLDFRKIEMGGEILYLTKGNITEFVSFTFENFRLISEKKNIDFSYHPEIPSVYIFFDADKLRKVINNLISNAFKFTREGGRISMSVKEEIRDYRKYIVISVEDTGKGISENELPNIFKRFHQVHGQEKTVGSGIGLHIVKEYINMHDGDVSVRSELGKGTVFSIYIPADLKPDENIPVTEIEEEQEEIRILQPEADQDKTLLIVEDNEEFRTYLKNELSQFYTVYEAVDGLEGEEAAIEREPDIIITDLMMPGIDGIELCRKIKNNIKISHIPVILLTANDNVENEKRGYKEGADAYISKPFHWEILLSRIDNLIAQKEQRQQAFENELDVSPEDITISPLDEELMKKAIGLVEANLGNSEYSIEDLSSDVCMSRSNLYRKINSITGLTPTDFVKNIRLKKAAELLKNTDMTMAEVAYTVGFNTPGYFTKSFKKLFGVLPTQYK